MREKATLKLDNGPELRVELDGNDLDHEGSSCAARRTTARGPAAG